MRYADPQAPCFRVINATECGAVRGAHADGRCPRDPRLKFQGRRPAVGRASASFSSAEIEAVHSVLNILVRGGDARIVARSEGARDALAKFVHMRNVVRAREGSEAAE